MKSLAVASDAPRGLLLEVKKDGAIRKGMRANDPTFVEAHDCGSGFRIRVMTWGRNL